MPTIMTLAVVAWGLGRVLTRFRRSLGLALGASGHGEARWVWPPLVMLVTTAWLVRRHRGA